jgi:hypothetical protein
MQKRKDGGELYNFVLQVCAFISKNLCLRHGAIMFSPPSQFISSERFFSGEREIDNSNFETLCLEAQISCRRLGAFFFFKNLFAKAYTIERKAACKLHFNR